MVPSVDRAASIGRSLLDSHPVLSRHRDALTVLVVGSVGSGFADQWSDIDLCFLCSAGAWDCVSRELVANGYRTAGWPNEIADADVHVHYFALPLSAHQEALAAGDDECLFLISHCVVVHDAGGQYSALVASHTPSADTVRSRVEVAWTLVCQRSDYLSTLLRRDQPLAWVNHVETLAHAALALCCWLDGQAPTGRKWLMRQASDCTQAALIVPAVRQMLAAMGRAVAQPPAEPRLLAEFTDAAALLREACRQAVEHSAHSHIAMGS